jgi:hypothetical protein
MVVRAAVRNVLEQLGSLEESVRDEGILQASALLEQEHSYVSYEYVLGRKSLLSTLPANFAESRPGSIRETYAHLLPGELLGRRLQPDESAAIVGRLVELLDRQVRIASVIFALGKSMHQDLIPRITTELRRTTNVDAWAVQQAAYTLEDLMYGPQHGRLAQQQQRVFIEACRAIAGAILPTRPYPASSPQRGYVPDPRAVALRVLTWTCLRFAPRKPMRLLPRRRSSRPYDLVVAVTETRPMPNGDVAVLGPLRANFLPESQAPATIHRDASQSIAARNVGHYFDLRAWPPQTAILLRGVTVNELPLGTIITVDSSEEARIILGRAEGTLASRSTFGEVSRAGLPDNTLIVVFKAPEEVTVPLADPIQSETSAERAGTPIR